MCVCVYIYIIFVLIIERSFIILVLVLGDNVLLMKMILLKLFISNINEVSSISDMQCSQCVAYLKQMVSDDGELNFAEILHTARNQI